jgi:hypothetical protein
MFVESCDQRLLGFRLPRREDNNHNYDYAENHDRTGHRAGPNLVANGGSEIARDHRDAPPNLGGIILPVGPVVKKNRARRIVPKNRAARATTSLAWRP